MSTDYSYLLIWSTDVNICNVSIFSAAVDIGSIEKQKEIFTSIGRLQKEFVIGC